MAMLELNQTNCEKLQCGAIPASVLDASMVTLPGYADPQSFATACSIQGWKGPLGGRFCSDPVCQPYKDEILKSGWGQGLECCVQAGGTWNGTSCAFTNPPIPIPVQATPPVLTPANIVQPLPDITQANTHVAVTESNKSCLCSLNDMINKNPLMAIAALAAATFVLLPKGARR